MPTLKAPGTSGAAPGTPGAKEQDQTEITAKEATFDSKTHQAVFIKDVVVVNPQFTVTADKVTAFMKQSDNPAIPGAAPAAGATPAATPAAAAKAGGPAASAKSAKKGGASTAAAGDAPEKGKSGGLERAIAEGNVVITQDKTDEDGNVTHSVGHGRKAVYEAATGDITLTGHPDVAQGINSLEATEDSTIIILNREGRMKAIGPHKSIIRDTGSDANNPLTGGGTGKTKTSSTTTTTATPNAR
jgi:lipopolysaccharide export system protein LptA